LIYINIFIILIYIMLALISKMHYSKYKGKCKEKSFKKLWIDMSGFVFDKLESRMNLDNLKQYIRKTEVVSNAKLDDMARTCVVKMISVCLAICLLCNFISAMVCISNDKKTDTTNIIEREGYEGETEIHDIYLNVDGDTVIYPLEVAPVEYTKDMFINQAEQILDELKTDMLKDNIDSEHICSDLNLPLQDENGIFKISWKSDYPEYIASTGRVCLDELKEDVPVIITATIEYLDYEASRDYVLIVHKNMGNADNSKIDIVHQTLKNIEGLNRNERSIVLPEEISGVKITVTQENKNAPMQILLFGVIICGLFVASTISRLKENGKSKVNMLLADYTVFVNKLWLLLGTGMTIKAGLKQIINESDESNMLIREIEYTINQIDSGFDEANAYEDLGYRIGLPSYARLLNHVSQNLKMGTKNLRKLMEDEVYQAFEERKEFARKKGEEASTKLLFPMIILLVMVMSIIMIPSIMSF